MIDVIPTEPVARILATPLVSIRPSATLRDAADALTADGVGLLVVIGHQGVLGVFSERDLVTAVAEGADIDVERVRDRTSFDMVQVDVGASVVEAAQIMARAEVRHLTVTRRGEVVGVVSMRDVVPVLAAGCGQRSVATLALP